MTVLDDVKPGAMIRGVVPGHSVRIVSVDWIGNQAINLVYREPDGGVSETTLYRDDENRLGIEARARASFRRSHGRSRPLRFLLATIRGRATIMAGLLIKELRARGPGALPGRGSLVEQWQDELGEKFGRSSTSRGTCASGNFDPYMLARIHTSGT